MNIDKFTQKSREAINGCESIASDYGNQEIEEEHLLYSHLTIDDSLILKLIEKMEIQKERYLYSLMILKVSGTWRNLKKRRQRQRMQMHQKACSSLSYLMK